MKSTIVPSRGILHSSLRSLPAYNNCLGNRTELFVPNIDWNGKKRTALEEGAQNPSQSSSLQRRGCVQLPRASLIYVLNIR